MQGFHHCEVNYILALMQRLGYISRWRRELFCKMIYYTNSCLLALGFFSYKIYETASFHLKISDLPL
jgi:hypothetical protein